MKINKYIDSTLLKPEATKQEIIDFCEQALKYDFAAVCVHNSRVALARSIIKDSNINISGTVGFPFGNTPTQIKVQEAQLAIQDGASEIDFVINLGAVKDHDWNYILDEMKQMRAAIPKNTIKVIFENCYLTREEIKKCSEIAIDAKMDFVKTSTGYGTSGAKLEDVKLMNEIVKGKVKVKAAGGIRTLEDAKKMIEAGAERLGTSGGVAIVNGQEHQNGY